MQTLNGFYADGYEPRSAEDIDHYLGQFRAELDQMSRAHAGRAFPADVRTRWNEVNAEVDRLTGLRSELDKRQNRMRQLVTNPYATERAGAPAVPPIGGGRADDRARRVIDAAHERGELPGYAAERATDLVVAEAAEGERSLAARWAMVTGAPDYRAAFAKLAADPVRGHLEWTPAEAEAFRAAAVEQRAMGIGSVGAGGAMVPLTLDPAILLTSDGSANPLRRIARVVQTTTNAWQGVTSAGATAEWKAEAATVADGSPTLASPEVPVHFGDSYVPYSFEVGMDAMNFLSELQRVLVDAADQLMATAYTTGSGSGQPTGITTALPAGSKVASATADALVMDDVVGLQNALPPRFQARAQWCANLTVINAIGSFETTNGSLRFPEVSNGQLLRKPLNELSALDAPGDTAAAGNDNMLLYGDFQQFLIVDRIGTTVEFIPNVLDPTTGRPTGQRGALLWFRTGSDVLVDNAFRLLTA